MADDFVTREEISEGLTNAHQDHDPETIGRMTDRVIEEGHGSQEEYEKHLAAHQEREAEKFNPNIDEEYFQEVRSNFDHRHISNPEHAAAFEFEKFNLINQGCSVVESETRARYILEARYGEDLFRPVKASELNPQIEKLQELGFTIDDADKIRIQAIMTTKNINAADALREVVESKGLWNHTVHKQINTAGGKEAEYFTALTKEDRRVLHGLKAAMPESNWTAQKFYQREYGRGLPKPQEPQEEMVPRAEYDNLVNGFENYKADWCRRHGVHPADLEAFLDE